MSGRADCLTVAIADRVAWVTIDHPPINLFNTPLIVALAEVARDLGEDAHIGAVVVQSADPDFFVAHGDLNSILGAVGRKSDSSPFQHMLEQFRQMPKPTIGKVNGIARGGGLELLAALDIRFCSLENTRLAQPEVPLGLIPGGGGTSRWPRLIGYPRAAELALSGADIDGATAEKWGMVNRAMPSAELDTFVDGLARRIASLPPHAVAMAKRVLQHEGPLADAMGFEADCYAQSAADPAAIAVMRKYMAERGQTREVETGPDPFGGLGNGAD
ncbi:MAG: enoyl-CoA hydratase/isomerase family protein [Novosphingobium sp.]|nr:enoyl-CoA hydratase/isomerase family protein [Novosphingobium sp.]